MKAWKLLVLALCDCIASAAVQHEHHAMAHHQAATGVTLQVKDDANAGVMTARLGPVNLPAHSDHHAIAQPREFFLMIPFDGWLMAYHPRLVSAAGEALPGRLVHHVAFWNTGRSDFLCPRKQEHIFGAGGEMNDWPALPGVGYRVSKGDRIRISTMFHNPTDRSLPETFLEVRMEYKRLTAGGSQLKSVYPTWFDVQQCGPSGYDLKPGQNVNTGELTVRYTGILLGVGGHLHDYGQRLDAENVTRRERVAVLDSKLDSEGRILSMPIVTFLDRGGYRLNRGDTVKVTATYNNPTGHMLQEGAMGIVVGYFLPDDDSQMAALKRKSKQPSGSQPSSR